MAGSWRDQADVPEEVRDQLPRGYDVVGHVAIIRLEEGLRPYSQEIGEALLEKVPPARTAAADWGVEGELRTRDLEVLAGDPELLTEHRENGLDLLVDLGTCYFSPRLARERERVAAQVTKDERVLDAYAGVGPYAVLAAKEHGTRVTALELNPHAARLCRENAQRNKVGSLVDVIHGDTPRLTRAMPAVFDRAILNLPHSATDHLADVLPAMRPGAVLHVGAMLAKDTVDVEASGIAGEHGLTLEEIVHVRNYNPAVGHYSLEIRLG